MKNILFPKSSYKPLNIILPSVLYHKKLFSAFHEARKCEQIKSAIVNEALVLGVYEIWLLILHVFPKNFFPGLLVFVKVHANSILVGYHFLVVKVFD